VAVDVTVAVAGVIFVGPPFGSFGTYPPTTTPARCARALALGFAIPSRGAAGEGARESARGGRGGLSVPKAGGLPTRLESVHE
jgi:hypothetical protein